MLVKLKERTLTSRGELPAGEVSLPSEEAQDLVRKGLASAVSPLSKFTSKGKGMIDRMFKGAVFRSTN